MFSRFLASAADIAKRIDDHTLAQRMTGLSSTIRAAVEEHGVFNDRKYGPVYAYEVDGFGSSNMMDDANSPSLLSIPMFGFVPASDKVYQNTRRKILSADSPYFARGPVLSGVGGPHTGPGKAWPMSSIVRILTSNDDEEIITSLKALLSTTDSLGLIHESINAHEQSDWSRPW